jgi:hypothetical protein
MIGNRPRSRDNAGRSRFVTERSEGNPRSGLTSCERSATPSTERADVGQSDRLSDREYRELLYAFSDSLIEYVVEATGEVCCGRAGEVLSEFELRRGLFWLHRGKPDGVGGLIRPGNPGWLESGGFQVNRAWYGRRRRDTGDRREGA